MAKLVRPIRIEGDVAYVTLTKGYEAIIDADDVPIVAGWNWCAEVRPHTIYARRNDHSNGRAKTIFLHRVIMSNPESLDIDHISGDGLDCRRSNMRTATRAENMFNMKIKPSNKSGFKGVHWNKEKGKWQARITVNYKGKHLGYFADPKDGHHAYIKASAQYHGAFGRTE